MSTTPRELLDTSIAQLELLRAFLGEQLGVRTDQPESTATSDVIACQEILISLGALILRVQATAPESGGLRSEYRFLPIQQGATIARQGQRLGQLQLIE